MSDRHNTTGKRPAPHRAPLRAGLGSVLGALWLSAGRRGATPSDLCPTSTTDLCPASSCVILVLLRESARLLPVCPAVSRRMEGGRPDAAIGEISQVLREEKAVPPWGLELLTQGLGILSCHGLMGKTHDPPYT